MAAGMVAATEGDGAVMAVAGAIRVTVAAGPVPAGTAVAGATLDGMGAATIVGVAATGEVAGGLMA